jgi:hypothetical protein
MPSVNQLSCKLSVVSEANRPQANRISAPAVTRSNTANRHVRLCESDGDVECATSAQRNKPPIRRTRTRGCSQYMVAIAGNASIAQTLQEFGIPMLTCSHWLRPKKVGSRFCVTSAGSPDSIFCTMRCQPSEGPSNSSPAVTNRSRQISSNSSDTEIEIQTAPAASHASA